MKYIFFLLSILIAPNNYAASLQSYLLPAPASLTLAQGRLNTGSSTVYIAESDTPFSKPLITILHSLEQSGFAPRLMPYALAYETPLLHASIDTRHAPQAYHLQISEEGIQLRGGSLQGLYYGLLSLQQIAHFAIDEGYWPCVSIHDEPDFERRGLMLDISRDKVPTMQSLFELVDQLAQWKINELQLYTEHTFAYENHHTVWQDASPMTALQIQQLDAYCRDHYIDLVPNQNSFGHMKRWLKHKEYEHLAELPKPGKTIWGWMSRTSLSPVEPGSLELMKELYAELLPNFSSPYFNIGCDETVELGVGKSKALCNKIGKGRVYLDFLLQLKEEVGKHGRKTQFWGDIILNHPELIPELPKDMTALIWGYEADYPFDRHCAQFKAAGLPYYVCPGTSTWNAIIGRNANGFANLKNAAVNGKKKGAWGYLNTNWGDNGHWQPLSVCYPGILYGAALGWNVEANSNIDIAAQVSQQILKDKSHQSGEALVALGNAYLKMQATTANSNIFHQLLRRNHRSIHSDRWLKKVSKKNTLATLSFIQQQLNILEQAPMSCADAKIVRMETRQAAQLAMHACHLALAKLATPDGLFKSIPADEKKKLRSELKTLITEHRRIWLLRNRPGGLKDSAAKMERVLASYQ
ncbi:MULTISPECIES: beta-N-acetylhexosaminidase [unclassified Carboxylicivirga]|uniref:beta-N-acetylhexosaminidase n=1 Tax=Carboxylicivirga TaxID=1628153 RepID=UPI003D355C1A